MRRLYGSMNASAGWMVKGGSMNSSLDGSMNGWSERIDDLERSSGRMDDRRFGRMFR